MVDHERLDAFTAPWRTGAKLVAVGDGKQLPRSAPAAFDRLAGTPRPWTRRRPSHPRPDERRAWAALRAGEPERAMAHYQARGQLYFMDTREQAGEAAVQRWISLTEEARHPPGRADRRRLQQEIDRLNARAQHLRAERGELGPREVPLPHLHYGLARPT